MDITIKSTAFLIDQLVTSSNACWHAQDKILDENLSDRERLAAAIRAQEMNSRRCALMQAIDKRLDEVNLSVVSKTYDK